LTIIEQLREPTGHPCLGLSNLTRFSAFLSSSKEVQMPAPLAPARVMLPWHKGALVHQAAEHLLDRHHCSYPIGDIASLEVVSTQAPLFVVVPGARAARILRRSLMQAAEVRGAVLYPPTVLTPGALFSELFPKIAEAAPSKLTRRLAWAAALETNKELLAIDFALLGAETVAIGDRLKLADRLEALSSELGAVALSFANVVSQLEQAGRDREAERWQRLLTLSESHSSILTSSGYFDIHQERLKAASLGLNTGKPIRVVLVGVSEMPAYVCKLLENSSDCKTEVLVFADSECEHMFDDWGRPQVENWVAANVPLSNSQIHSCSSLHHEAQLAAQLVHEESERCEQKIVIGAVGVSQQMAAKQALVNSGIEAHISEGISGASLPAVKALREFHGLLQSNSWQAFSTVMRNPYLKDLLLKDAANDARAPQWVKAIEQADAWHSIAFPRYAPALEDLPECNAELRQITSALGALSETWQTKKKLALSEWVPELAEFWQMLSECWKATAFMAELDTFVITLLEQFAASKSDFAESFSATEVLTEFLGQLSSLAVPHEQSDVYKDEDAASIDVVGWLELLHDPAHGVVLLGLNEGILPEARVHDPFLPDGLKEQLLVHSEHARWTTEQRFARDVYLFSSLLHSKRVTHVSFSAKGESGDLLMPGRLLYRCADSELGARLHHLQHVLPRLTVEETKDPIDGQGTWQLPPSPGAQVVQLAKISVTDFKQYIQSPYRYYLRRVVRAGRLNDQSEELDPGSFGSLLHKVLEHYGWSSTLQKITNADALTTALWQILDDLISKVYRVKVLPALLVQFEVVRARLRIFAEAQVAWQASGWQQCNERARLHPEFTLQRELDVDGSPVLVQGRIDRIDFNLASKQFALLDYKTGDQGYGVEKSHRTRPEKGLDGWLSLQMPLYQWMASEHPYFEGKEITTGFVSLTKENSYEIKELVDWRDEMESALDCARSIVRAIRAGKLHPQSEDQEIQDEFSLLCGYGQQGLVEGGLLSYSQKDTQITGGAA
jgi:ATP-dependent helicase/nuclease subunit B